MFISEQPEEWPDCSEEDADASAAVAMEVQIVSARLGPDDPVEAILMSNGRWSRRRRILAGMLAWRLCPNTSKMPDEELLRLAQELLVRQDQAKNPVKVPKGLVAVGINGILHVKGRLDQEVVPPRTANRMIIAPSKLAMTMLKDCNVTLFHGPAQHLLNQVNTKEGIFIIGGRRAAQKVVNLCPVCQRAH